MGASTTDVLPNLSLAPSFDILHSALKNLTIAPVTWNEDGTGPNPAENDEKVVNKFLLSVVSNELAWHTEEQRETIHELASERISERCGRTAAPEMTRTWMITATSSLLELGFAIKEPRITEDNLGFKTWGTAYALSKQLEQIGQRCLKYMVGSLKQDRGSALAAGMSANPNTRVLELGSGTGLVGIAVAAVWGVDVLLTDLPNIIDNLQYNVDQNSATVSSNGGSIKCKVLDWKNEEHAAQTIGDQTFEIVVAADPMYDDDHPLLVANMIAKYLKEEKTSAALVAVPMRDKNTKAMYRDFVDMMRERDMQLKDQGGINFMDDWGTAGDEGVECWWSIWGWDVPWVTPALS
ncbi:putative methyltransferase-domain-containing protein [Calycina marina]|uniref:Methyltransferase-domain-containing protein n=1 Tax=Calycina marina TaxID=1763456 RepID=A0A9P8CFT8_9HELO|nr:putative methyltransferase-domain-containing protein [Calycina marina]